MAGVGTVSVDLKANTGSFETDMARAARTAKTQSESISFSVGRMGELLAGVFAAERLFEFAKSVALVRRRVLHSLS